MKVALAGCLLSATCDQVPVPPLLICAPNQLLGTDASGQLVCVTAPQGALRTPSCATGLTSDGQQLLCTTKNNAADTDQDVSAALAQMDDPVQTIALLLKPAIPAKSYVGLTPFISSGDFYYNGPFTEGVLAGSRTCEVTFGTGAHVCMMDELYQAVVNGTLKATDTIPASWVYMPNWNTPVPGAETPLKGVADNCGGFSYQLSARRWLGVTVAWGPLPDGSPGFRWQGSVSCSTSLHIACCK